MKFGICQVSSVVYENFLKLPAPQKKLIMNPPNSNPYNNTDFVFLILYFIWVVDFERAFHFFGQKRNANKAYKLYFIYFLVSTYFIELRSEVSYSSGIIGLISHISFCIIIGIITRLYRAYWNQLIHGHLLLDLRYYLWGFPMIILHTILPHYYLEMVS